MVTGGRGPIRMVSGGGGDREDREVVSIEGMGSRRGAGSSFMRWVRFGRSWR